MSMLSDDLAAIFADTSLTVSVEFGTSPKQRTTGFLTTKDVFEEDGAGGVAPVSRSVLTIASGALDNLASNATITVDDVVYTIHGRPRSGGRGRTELTLVEGT